jgi:hypothetical protein
VTKRRKPRPWSDDEKRIIYGQQTADHPRGRHDPASEQP